MISIKIHKIFSNKSYNFPLLTTPDSRFPIPTACAYSRRIKFATGRTGPDANLKNLPL
ncbi:MAG: hypothetical protein F6K63_21230 [Moorea sp. SIO1G6]|uniref:hypothetical protein n=1 Tax=Moorena sp. SIO1G6 TaxID=2607840 RepID=UPI0013C17736|nr:hypothetical protein [Moorena sp. SIO1G6]NET66770.1 hypothetical protein [Moorena sp. SIO1G6]